MSNVNALAVAGLVLGVLSLGLDATIIGVVLGVPVAIIGFVLSVFGVRHPDRRMGIAGTICSALGFAVPFAVFLYLVLPHG